MFGTLKIEPLLDLGGLKMYIFTEGHYELSFLVRLSSCLYWQVYSTITKCYLKLTGTAK